MLALIREIGGKERVLVQIAAGPEPTGRSSIVVTVLDGVHVEIVNMLP
jgi:hypothetical protein